MKTEDQTLQRRLGDLLLWCLNSPAGGVSPDLRREANAALQDLTRAETIEEAETPKRYLCFFYQVVSHRRQLLAAGHLSSEWDHMPSREQVGAEVRAEVRRTCSRDLPRACQVLITGWNEFASREDCLAFIGKDKAPDTDT